MKKLTISELFNGYDDIEIPTQISENTSFDITLSSQDLDNNSLLFITEKVGKENPVISTELFKASPFAIVISKHHNTTSSVCPEIKVGNVRTALAYALSNLYGLDYYQTKVIGVTGTNGKTTTATLIYKMLKECGYKVGFIGTGKIISDTNILSDDKYSMTTPDPDILYPAIAKMTEVGCKYIVMEVSSHAIALGKIAPIKFEYSIFTNLDNDHLDFHNSKEEYFQTKLKLFELSKKGLFNMDDKYSRKAAELSKCEKSTFGIINSGDAYASEIFLGSEETSFYYRERDLIFKAHTKLIGAFNVYNIIAALKCIIDLGIKPCIAKKALRSIDRIDGRMEIIRGEITAIIDYAHTPKAFYNCLKTIKQNINAKQNLIVVFGCGGDRDTAKRPYFGQYAEAYADKIIITEDNLRNEDFSSIVNDITRDMTSGSYETIRERESAIRYAFKCARPGDIVAVIGKGHEKYKIVGGEYLPFDERKIIEDILSEMDGTYAGKT